MKTPRLLSEPGRCGPFIDAVISSSNDYTHWRPVPMETGWTTTTHAGRASLSANHFSRQLNIRVGVHDLLPSEIIKLNALTVPPLKRIVNANVDTVIGNA
jgi:hypothetical protein